MLKVEKENGFEVFQGDMSSGGSSHLPEFLTKENKGCKQRGESGGQTLSRKTRIRWIGKWSRSWRITG